MFSTNALGDLFRSAIVNHLLKADLEAQEDLQHMGGYITDSDDEELDAHLGFDDDAV